MTWLKGLLVSLIIEAAPLLWAALMKRWREWRAIEDKKEASKENDAVEQKVEDAATPEEIQSALDDAAGRYGKR